MASNPRKRPAETQEEAWVADEDRFVLQQAKKKAALRVRAGRGRPIDLLAVALRTIDPSRNGFDDDDDDDTSAAVDPEAVFEGLDAPQLEELEKEIETYLALEKNRSNYEYWQTMKVVCRDHRRESLNAQGGKSISSVIGNLDKILAPKTLAELGTLEKQIKQKLRSNEPIDVDYWEGLLSRLAVHKARAQLRKVTQEVTGARMKGLRTEQDAAAQRLAGQVATRLASSARHLETPVDVALLDPDAQLKLSVANRALPLMQQHALHASIRQDRQRIRTAGASASNLSDRNKIPARIVQQASPASTAAYDREVARGMGENEELFAVEEVSAVTQLPVWADKYEPRKPRYYNRVQTGFEWNKYNQLHYDQDSPPPKVVQGYKFNIFYPDLVDVTKAPTYRIEREHGRRRGQTLAPAGEDDTCVIRFVAGPPYLDVAFRIVDREWDYSAKFERGFLSSFENGVLQLHFQFRKVFYRK